MEGMNSSYHVSFDDWIASRKISCWGTNSGAPLIAFQEWRRFKEAFAPELIKRAIDESPIPVKTCLDPFGGSGTTALACQFMGVAPVTIEVNPYLADLIQAKLESYDLDSLTEDLGSIIRSSYEHAYDPLGYFKNAPSTFIHGPGKDRWIFNHDVAERIVAFRESINALKREKHRRLFTALLGGVVVEASNVVISGKGRRYRKNWQNQQKSAADIDHLFRQLCVQAVGEIFRYKDRASLEYRLIRGDSRAEISKVGQFDICIFSPPYPNSFDYTDVYNVELWALGYLDGKDANTQLRKSTLSSHVQIYREFPKPPSESSTLKKVMRELNEVRLALWNKHIPEMVGGYFADMKTILQSTYQQLTPGGTVWMVVGDSCYAGVEIPVAKILVQISKKLGFSCDHLEPFRSMRVSPQQGGQHGLDETLIVLKRPAS